MVLVHLLEKKTLEHHLLIFQVLIQVRKTSILLEMIPIEEQVDGVNKEQVLTII